MTPQPEDNDRFRVITASPEETQLIGELLGRTLTGSCVVCLRGELGSGKTCLTQGIGRGMDVDGVIHSPTFVFINEHPPHSSGPCLYHVDLYRVYDADDVFALGLEEYMCGDGVTVIEWADRAQELMPSDCLWITLTYLDEERRRLQFEARGESYTTVLSRLRDAVASEGGLEMQDCDGEGVCC